MTNHPCLEVPFDAVEKWEKIEGSCARLYAAAEWGYKKGLATPPPESPTDEELLELMPETMRDEFSYAAKVCSDATGGQVKPGIFRVVLNATALDFARAALERWGRWPPSPQVLPVAPAAAAMRMASSTGARDVMTASAALGQAGTAGLSRR